MAIRPPRATRPPRRTRLVRDLVIIALVSLAVLLFGLRCLLAILGIETWTATWKLVDVPTGLLVAPLEKIDALTQTPIGDLTLATIIVSAVCFLAALVVLGSLANQRD
ncbi:MAG TPA: hypothetical protein VFV93_17455 [Thermomicrobiales bacterium]|nr:hypothetical protein [Thermomicrobiales bacterium]